MKSVSHTKRGPGRMPKSRSAGRKQRAGHAKLDADTLRLWGVDATPVTIAMMAMPRHYGINKAKVKAFLLQGDA